MGVKDWLKPRIQDAVMRFSDPLRAESLAPVAGDVLEVGFGTGRNLPFYPASVRSLAALDPLVAPDWRPLALRIAAAPFPVVRHALRADGALPFAAERFDCVVSTWTLCSIPDPLAALAEMRRVLRPGGQYVFIEHGCSLRPATLRLQEWLNPVWCRIADGCNLNRAIDALIRASGFEITRLDCFEFEGPRVLAQMYRGVAQARPSR